MTSGKKFSRITTIASIALFGVCAWYVVQKFQWEEIYQSLDNIDWLWFFTSATCASVLFWFIRGVRWGILLKACGVAPPWREVFLYTAVTFSVSNYTPGMLGELAKVEFLRRHRPVDRLTLYGIFLVERTLDTLCMALLAMLVLFVPLEGEVITRVQKLLLPVTLGVAAVVALIAWRASRTTVGRDFLTRLKGVTPKVIAQTAGLTLCGWLVMSWAWQQAIISSRTEISLYNATALCATIGVVAKSTFVPGSVGIGEAVVSEALKGIGFNSLQSQLGALLQRLFSLWMLALALPLIPWVWWLRTPTEPPLINAGTGASGTNDAGTGQTPPPLAAPEAVPLGND